jgi:hypothetical protein
VGDGVALSKDVVSIPSIMHEIKYFRTFWVGCHINPLMSIDSCNLCWKVTNVASPWIMDKVSEYNEKLLLWCCWLTEDYQ